MTPEQWQKIKSVLEKAVELSPASRLKFLDEACQGDENLRREVESLLDFDDADADLLEQDAFSVVVQNASGTDAKNFIGRQIGNYKIVGELGAGGMGAVFLAERADGAFEQKVALKVVKSGMNSNVVLRRFFKERQILAALDHPNIAHLIDGGTTADDLPFFVMEYIEGETILDYAESENLNLDQRLNLFRQVCSAASYAHQNLVIHRDLKPSNILITRDGKVKLLDFGIAKLLKSGISETATQHFLFTPEYASPEQVRGEKLTTATDVYSLGVILYELLTGSRPYKTNSRNISEIIRAVCETEPVRPSSLVSPKSENRTQQSKQQITNDEEKITNPKSKIQNPKSLQGDLDNIILKALRKEPARRYSSIEQFSEDIHRHLEGLPVSASKDTWSYRTSKFIQRNRLGVAAVGLILLSLFGGLFATLYQRNKAQRRFNEVRRVANSFLFEFHDAIENLSGSTAARELVVKRALEYLDNLASEAAGDLTLQRELGTAYERIGKIQGNSYYSNLGDTEGAMNSYQRSLEIRRKLADTDPANRELQYELARSLRGVGDMFYTMNDLKGGLESYEKGVSVLEKIVAAEPNNENYLSLFADILSRRGDIKGMDGFPNLGDTQGAVESYHRVVEVGEKLTGLKPDDPEYAGDYATRLIYFGRLQSAIGDAKGSIESINKSIDIFERLSAVKPDDVGFKLRLILALTSVRPALLDEGRTTEAIENSRRVINTLEKLSAEDPKNAQFRRSLGVGYTSLATSLVQAKDFKGAIENYRQALTISEKLSAADPKNAENRRDILLNKQFLAEAQIETGEYDAALSNLRQNALILEEMLKSGDSNSQTKTDTAFCLELIGRALAAKNSSSYAAENYSRAARLAEESLKQSAPNARMKARYAALFFDAGKVFAALAQKEGDGKTKAQSCAYFKTSLELWNEMRQAGTLSTINADRPNKAEKELAGCNL